MMPILRTRTDLAKAREAELDALEVAVETYLPSCLAQSIVTTRTHKRLIASSLEAFIPATAARVAGALAAGDNETVRDLIVAGLASLQAADQHLFSKSVTTVEDGVEWCCRAQNWSLPGLADDKRAYAVRNFGELGGIEERWKRILCGQAQTRRGSAQGPGNQLRGILPNGRRPVREDRRRSSGGVG